MAVVLRSLRVQSNAAVAVEGGMAEQLPHDGFGRSVLSPDSRLPSMGISLCTTKRLFSC